MKYAEKITDIINAFKSSPLSNAEELKEFYYENTMEFRTGDKYSSPIQDIFEACQMPAERNAFLLLGHKGCGKSTELNKMAVELRKKGYYVYTIQCGRDLDLNNPLYTDLLILLGEALIKIAEGAKCSISSKLRGQIQSFWAVEAETDTTVREMSTASMETGVRIATPNFFSTMLQLFSSVKVDLKLNAEKRTQYREKINQRSGEWLLMLKLLADEITEKLVGKQPIIIFEDLDKINPEDAWEVFENHAVTLTGVSFPIIYTFPVALNYDYRFPALGGYFIAKTLPMIKQKTVDGSVYQEGVDAIFEIIRKRARLELFETGVLNLLIKKTGGALRDLFYAINAATQRAIRREAEVVSPEDAQVALDELKTALIRRIERKDYGFLADIYKGNKELIEDKRHLLEMLQANVVLEYNGRGWHDVHPLVADFLIEQKLV